MSKLKTIKADERRHKIITAILNVIVLIIVPLVTIALYVQRDAPKNMFVWQDYVISTILYISPIVQVSIARWHRNNKLKIEQRRYNEQLGTWNAVSKVSQEDISDNLKQEIYNLKMDLALLRETVNKHNATIDNHDIKIETLIKY